VLEAARDDINEIYDYIAYELGNPIAATRLVLAFNAEIESLAYHPSSIALVYDERLAARGYRRMIVGNYLIFFIVDEQNKLVEIERILYGRRDWANILTKP